MTTDKSCSNIIKTKHKRVEVQACPGSGKTTTLLERWEYLRNERNVPDNKILILSFSNSTVGVIKERIYKSITNTKPPPAESGLPNVTVQTVHGFAYTLIYGSAGYVDVLDDKQVLLASVLRSTIKATKKNLLWAHKSTKIKKLRLEKLKKLLEPINLKLVSTLLEVKRASKQSLSATLKKSQFSKLSSYHNVIIKVQRRFDKFKKTKGVMDFTDMLVEAGKIIDGDSSTVQFTHILVDEYQDCSAAQIRLLTKLANLPRRSLMVFGDQNQAVYSFSGAAYIPLSSVLDGVTTLSLPFSFRLTKQTAALASAVAQLPKQRAIKSSHNGEMPILVNDESLTAQIKHILVDIQLLIADGAEPHDIVVLARTKAQLGYIEASLLSQNLLTDREGLIRKRCHVIRALKLVRVVERCCKNNEDVQLEMLRNALPKINDVIDSLWKQEVSKLRKALAILSLEGRYRLCAAIYLRLMGGVRKNPELRSEVNRWEAYCRGHEDATAMYHAIRKMDGIGVVTSTIHAAKGQEWDHVLILGVTDGVLPIYFARDDASLAEERNLLYVAITRARKTLRLYNAPIPHARSRQSFGTICRFLKEPAVKKTLEVE